MDLQKLSVQLFHAGAVRFGTFKLKSGINSPVFIDLRVIISHPNILETVAEHVWDRVKGCDFNLVCGDPYTALPIATWVSLRHNKPILIRHKEAKSHETKNQVDGKYQEGDKCLVIEDVVTSGASVVETVQCLQKAGVTVTDAVVFVDREQGGATAIKHCAKVTLHSVLTITELAGHLHAAGLVSSEQLLMVRDFVQCCQVGEALYLSQLSSSSAAVLIPPMVSPTSDVNMSSLDGVILRLYNIGSFKFGQFTLSNGLVTPIYMDLRLIISHPELMTDVCKLMWDVISADGSARFDIICGVPMAALHLATCIAKDHHVAQVLARQQAKTYGTSRLVEGVYKQGDTCLVVEDVMVSGEGVYTTAESLRRAGILVRDSLCVVDREQAADDNLLTKGIKSHCLMKISYALKVLVAHGKIDEAQAVESLKFLHSNPVALPARSQEASIARQALPFAQRATLAAHPLTKELFTIMDAKKTNLCVAADVVSTKELLEIADELGPYICLLKTHADVLEHFSEDVVAQLQTLAAKHRFLIFEDRKYADIGHTVELQYSAGIHKTSQWADIVTAHSLPGNGVIKGLKNVGLPLGRACVLVAQMSVSGSLTTQSYATETLKMAENNKDFVIGFISQSRISSDPAFVHMTPGVSLLASTSSSDGLGQQYVSPQEAVCQRGADVVIVGRAILASQSRSAACRAHQQAAYSAYLGMIASEERS